MRMAPILVSLLCALGCPTPEPDTDMVDAAVTAPAEQEPEPEPLVLSASEDELPEMLSPLIAPWHGDLDGMVERPQPPRVIRAVVAVSMTLYFLDGAVQRGITYEALQQFEASLNKKLDTGNLKVHIAIVPIARDKLLPALV